MTRIVAVALILCLCLAAAAQDVEVTLTNGSILQGELLGFDNGKYRVLVNGQVQEFKETEVVSVVLLERGRSDHPSLDPLDENRKALQDGRDAAQAAAVVVRSLKSLSPNDQRKLLDIVQTALTGRTVESFPAEFADRVSKDPALPAGQRIPLARVLETVGRSAEKDHRATSAWKIYRAVTRLDFEREPALQSARIEQAYADANARFRLGEFPAAIEASEEVLTLKPGHEEAARIREEALYRRLQKDLAERPERRRALLQEYLKSVKRDDYRRWAEAEFAKSAPTESPESKPNIEGDVARYYPVTPGLWWRYRVGEGVAESDTFQKVKITEVRLEDAGWRVHFSLDSIYKSYTSTRSYQFLVTPTSVALSAGSEAELAFPLLKCPAQSGLSWSSQTGSQKFLRQITSMSSSVSTSAGNFNDCLEVTFTSTMTQESKEIRIVSRSYYAPQVGLVKLEFDDAEYKKFNLVLVDRGKE